MQRGGESMSSWRVTIKWARVSGGKGGEERALLASLPPGKKCMNLRPWRRHQSSQALAPSAKSPKYTQYTSQLAPPRPIPHPPAPPTHTSQCCRRCQAEPHGMELAGDPGDGATIKRCACCALWPRSHGRVRLHRWHPLCHCGGHARGSFWVKCLRCGDVLGRWWDECAGAGQRDQQRATPGGMRGMEVTHWAELQLCLDERVPSS